RHHAAISVGRARRSATRPGGDDGAEVRWRRPRPVRQSRARDRHPGSDDRVRRHAPVGGGQCADRGRTRPRGAHPDAFVKTIWILPLAAAVLWPSHTLSALHGMPLDPGTGPTVIGLLLPVV